MPSNFTKNYSLSQWERSDKVLMDDFNADNAKIDAALAFHPSAELICSAVATDDEPTLLTLDISQVDWNRYFMLYLSVHKDTRDSVTITTDKGNGYGMRLTNGSENNDHYMAHFYEAMEVRAFFFVGYNGASTPVLFGTSTCQKTGDFSEWFQVNTGFVSFPYQELSELRVGGSKFGLGAKVDLWGIK